MQSLLIKMRFNGQELSTGTGFVADTAIGPVLVTNRHNVTGRRNDDGTLLSKTGAVPNEIVIVHNRVSAIKDAVGGWVEHVEPLFDDEKPRWREHPWLGPKADFVALPLTQLENVRLLPYNFSLDGIQIPIAPAQPVSVIGFPFGITAGGSLGVWATGFIASEPEVNYNDLPILLIDCRTRQGQSGSPVIAFRSAGTVMNTDRGVGYSDLTMYRIIGIYSGRINDQSDIGIVWKASAIVELLDSFAPRKANFGFGSIAQFLKS